MTSAQQEAIRQLSRQGTVISLYRFLIELAFLFAAFTEFPDHKWSIGLAVLAFDAAFNGIGHVLRTADIAYTIRLDDGEMKTRHAIVNAAELAGQSVEKIHRPNFWAHVVETMKAERTEYDGEEPAVKPMGFWLATTRGAGALLWQLTSTIFGITLVAALTSGN